MSSRHFGLRALTTEPRNVRSNKWASPPDLKDPESIMSRVTETPESRRANNASHLASIIYNVCRYAPFPEQCMQHRLEIILTRRNNRAYIYRHLNVDIPYNRKIGNICVVSSKNEGNKTQTYWFSLAYPKRQNLVKYALNVVMHSCVLPPPQVNSFGTPGTKKMVENNLLLYFALYHKAQTISF